MLKTGNANKFLLKQCKKPLLKMRIVASFCTYRHLTNIDSADLQTERGRKITLFNPPSTAVPNEYKSCPAIIWLHFDRYDFCSFMLLRSLVVTRNVFRGKESYHAVRWILPVCIGHPMPARGNPQLVKRKRVVPAEWNDPFSFLSDRYRS